MSKTLKSSDRPITSELQRLYTTSVDSKQIDQLGHMNVRFYGVHALAGARELVARLGLEAEGSSSYAAFTDVYTRHYREQLEDAPLEVWGGVLDVGETDIRTYYELRNPVLEEIAATFVYMVQRRDANTHAALSLDESITEAAASTRVAWPDHGRPRSLNLDASPRAYSISEMKSMDLRVSSVHVVNQRNFDSEGIFQVDTAFDLIWGSDGMNEDTDWLRTLDNGDKMGFATMESRCSFHEMPQPGARVRSYGAVVDISNKAKHECFWVYDVDREVLLCTASFVEVAFNTNTRRAIEIPDFERERLEENFRPDMA